MATTMKFLGHGSWLIESAGETIALDPFLTDNPLAPIAVDDVQASYILVSHGHFDHVGDLASIAQRCQSTVVGVPELVGWLESQHGVGAAEQMNLGGQISLPFGTVKMVPALHSCDLPDGSSGGTAAGYVISFAEGTVYFACDTGLFLDMQLIGRIGIDIAVLPIGDRFTMGPADAVEAVKLLQPGRVIPVHYNTWPPIEQDVDSWAVRVKNETQSEPLVIEPGGVVTLD